MIEFHLQGETKKNILMRELEKKPRAFDKGLFRDKSRHCKLYSKQRISYSDVLYSFDSTYSPNDHGKQHFIDNFFVTYVLLFYLHQLTKKLFIFDGTYHYLHYQACYYQNNVRCILNKRLNPCIQCDMEYKQPWLKVIST